MVDERERPVYAALERLCIPYERFSHPPVMTMEDCDRVDAGLGVAHCKNLFLSNRQGTAFYILSLLENKAFKTKDVSKQIGSARLSFGTPEQLFDRLKLLPGSVTPLAVVNDPTKSVTVLLDREIVNAARVIVHPLVNTASLILATADLMRFIEQAGNPLVLVDIGE